MARRYLREHAGIHIQIVDFSVINIVGAVDLGVQLDTSSAITTPPNQLDRATFVAWTYRSDDESIASRRTRVAS